LELKLGLLGLVLVGQVGMGLVGQQLGLVGLGLGQQQLGLVGLGLGQLVMVI
jgi:hypothetical protein